MESVAAIRRDVILSRNGKRQTKFFVKLILSFPEKLFPIFYHAIRYVEATKSLTLDPFQIPEKMAILQENRRANLIKKVTN